MANKILDINNDDKFFALYSKPQEKEILLKRFLEAQLTNATKGDWITHIRYILIILKVDKTIEEIKCMKIKHFMEIFIRKTKIMLLGKTISKGTDFYFIFIFWGGGDFIEEMWLYN